MPDVLRDDHRPPGAPRGEVGDDAGEIQAVVQMHDIGRAASLGQPAQRAQRPERIGKTEQALDAVPARRRHGLYAAHRGRRGIAIARMPLELGDAVGGEVLGELPGDALDAAAVRRIVVRYEGDARSHSYVRRRPSASGVLARHPRWRAAALASSTLTGTSSARAAL